MDAQSPSKRFTRGFWGMFKLNTMQYIMFKLRSIPIRLGDGGVKDQTDVVAGSNKKRKYKNDVYIVHNDKNKTIGSRSLEHDKVSV
ncbi:hypothetical protein EJD97_004332 [Solanum chilense]|uniref:Uncharacterized protein n=1 Tax=Solanum chilense TaxID=4083 RepID=A0A6N2ASM7_SOLCI|nr:hypothetical protein EJD97_004332 [Solanum chilense]